MTYTITLQDAPFEITDRAKENAQARFKKTLERTLGSAEDVLTAYQAWQMAQETAEDELSAEQIKLAKQWINAATKAQTEGFRDLGESEAYFEINIDR